MYRRLGLTMVETVMALTILGVSIVAIFGLLQACGHATHHCDMLTRAALLAETLMVETKNETNLSFGSRQGQDPRGSFVWRIQLAPTEEEQLAAIQITVRWLEQQREQRYDLVSLHFLPPMFGG